LNAFLITRLRIIPFVATLGTMVAGRGLALLLSKSQAVAFPDEVVKIGSVRIFEIVPLPILLFATVVLVAAIFLRRTQTGRQIYAVGFDINVARKAGINTGKILVTSYISCGLLASLGGFISVAQLGIINAGFGKGDEFDAIAAAVLGGTSLFGGIGSVFPGTVIGAILIQMISSGLVFTQVNLYLQPMFTGGIIFLAVFLDSLRTNRLEKLRKRNIRIEHKN
jgi:ribose/xylose/arabinose/galactoside ABC-type transport system permease subunit